MREVRSKRGVDRRPASKVGSIAVMVLVSLATVGCNKEFYGTAPQSMLKCDYRALKKASRRGGPAIVSEAYKAVSEVPLNAVQIGDQELFYKVMVQSLFADLTPTGTVKVTVRMANCSDSVLSLRARTSFLGKGNVPAEPPSAWQTVFLEPKSLGLYEALSLSTTAVDTYYIELAPNN